MLIKHDCTAGGERKRSKQGFISLVFQAAVFSLSITGRERGRGGEGEERERWWRRCSGSINQGRFQFCCYPEVGCFPDLKALAYQRGCLPQSTVFSTVNHNASPFPGSRSAISQQQEAIRSCSRCSTDAENSHAPPLQKCTLPSARLSRYVQGHAKEGGYPSETG